MSEHEIDCDQAREALSASVDGEDLGVAQATVDAHVAGCVGCQAFADGTVALNRSVRVRPAEAVPDLTAAILDSAPARARLVPEPPAWARYGLLTVAVTVLVLAVPELLTGTGPHDGRDLAAFEVALCAAMLVVVWKPYRAAGLVPMVVTLAVASLISVAVDVVNGEVPIVAEANHVLILVGLALLWVIARPEQRRQRLQPALT
jgi:predicted anti-sigma-YlaC factor YlaD